MAQIFSQDVIEIALIGDHAGRPVVNVLHVQNDEVGGNDASKVLDVVNNWQDHIVPPLNQAYTFSHAQWRSLDPDDNNAGVQARDNAKPITGASAAMAASPQVAFLVHKVTPNRPRGRRDGRMYLAGVSEPDIDETGALVPNNVTIWNGILTDFVNGVNDADWSGVQGSGLVVLETTPASRAPGALPVTLESRAVTSMRMDPLAATQRGRLR